MMRMRKETQDRLLSMHVFASGAWHTGVATEVFCGLVCFFVSSVCSVLESVYSTTPLGVVVDKEGSVCHFAPIFLGFIFGFLYTYCVLTSYFGSSGLGTKPNSLGMLRT